MPGRRPEILVTDTPTYNLPAFEQHHPRLSRLKLFGVLFMVSALIGLGYTFARRPVYVSGAIVMIRGALVSDEGGDADPRSELSNVRVHAQALHSPALLDQAYASIPQEFRQKTRVSATAFPEADAVELRAQGPKPEVLPALLDAWMKAYSEQAQSSRRDSASHDDTSLREQLAEIDRQISTKQADMDSFRETGDIVSLQREDNRVLAALRGLNTSLDQATQQLAKARAVQTAIKDSIANNRLFLLPSDKRRIEYLERRATTLKAQLKRYQDSFTPEYMALDSKYRDLTDELATIEERLKTEPARLQQNSLQQADQDVVGAEAVVSSLQTKLEEEKARAKEFDKKFSQYSTMEREIQQLQEMKRTMEKRLVEAKVAMESTGLQLKVLQEPDLPDAPAYPHYARDAGISLGAALGIALVGVLLYEFLTRPHRSAGPAPHPWPVLVPIPGEALGAPQRQAYPPLDRGGGQLLGRAHRRELSGSEVSALVVAAAEPARDIILLALSGLRAEEILALKVTDLDLGRALIHVKGPNPRDLEIPVALYQRWKTRVRSETMGPGPLLQTNLQSPADLDRLLADTAEDAGLAYAQEVDSETLRHTYLAYLVRQGLRLSDLRQIAGELPHTQMEDYRRLSPPGPKIGLNVINLPYPFEASPG